MIAISFDLSTRLQPDQRRFSAANF